MKVIVTAFESFVTAFESNRDRLWSSISEIFNQRLQCLAPRIRICTSANLPSFKKRTLTKGIYEIYTSTVCPACIVGAKLIFTVKDTTCLKFGCRKLVNTNFNCRNQTFSWILAPVISKCPDWVIFVPGEISLS